MKQFINAAALGLIVALGAPAAFADPKPAGAKSAPGQLVANSLAGKTQKWKECKGGIYYGGQWEAVAWCERKGPSVGIGTWTVKGNGRVCHELTWYWPEGDSYGSKKDPVKAEDCHDHVVAPDGELWRFWGGGQEWWKFENDSSLVKGFALRGKVNRLRRKLGV